MAKQTSKLSVSRVLEIVDQTVESWVKDQGSSQKIFETVRHELDGALKQIARYAIGIDDNSHGNRIELSTRSPGYKLIQEKIKAAAQAWLEEHPMEYQPTSSELDSLKRHFAKEYDKFIRGALTNMAEERAKADAQLIIDRVGLTTEKMRGALEDLIQGEEKAMAAEEAARGKAFIQRTKLKFADVQGVVAYDGERLSDLIQEPDASCWHVVQLCSVFEQMPDPAHRDCTMDCHILTNGQEWHPVDAVFDKDGFNCEASRVMESFRSSRQMIFNFLDEADRLFIASAIANHYRKKNPLGNDDIPF